MTNFKESTNYKDTDDFDQRLKRRRTTTRHVVAREAQILWIFAPPKTLKKRGSLQEEKTFKLYFGKKTSSFLEEVEEDVLHGILLSFDIQADSESDFLVLSIAEMTD